MVGSSSPGRGDKHRTRQRFFTMPQSPARFGTQSYRPPRNDFADKVGLHLNENLLETTRVENASAFSRALATGCGDLHRYPRRGISLLQEAIASHLSVREDQIVVAPGSSSMLQHVVLNFMNEGETLLVPDPSWSFYESIARVARVQVARFPLRKTAHGFVYDVDSLQALMSRLTPRIVLLCSPNNPTGNTLPAGDVIALADSHPNTYVVVDQAYHGFVPDQGDAALVAHATSAPNLLLTRSFSKFLGLANLRIGYVIANETAARQLQSITPVFGLPSFVQAIASERIGHLELHARMRKEYSDVRDFFLAAVGRIPGLVPLETRANFVLLEYDERLRGLDQRLWDAGYVIKRLRIHGHDNYLRITLADLDTMRRLVAAIEDAARGDHAS